MAVWVVAEAAQLALASDVMLAASAGTVFSGHAFGAVAHRKAAQPGLTWGRAVVAVAHESRPSPRQLPQPKCCVPSFRRTRHEPGAGVDSSGTGLAAVPRSTRRSMRSRPLGAAPPPASDTAANSPWHQVS